MKNKFLKLIAISLFSLFLFVGCSKNTVSLGNNKENDTITNDNNDKDNSTSTDKKDNNQSSNNNNASLEADLEKKIKNKFEEAFSKIYNTDYTDESKAMEAEDYIKSNFTPEGSMDMINKIISYNTAVSESELTVTLIKKVENIDARFSAMYELRYNVAVTFDKPTIYADLISILFIDKDGNILIESLNQNNF